MRRLALIALFVVVGAGAARAQTVTRFDFDGQEQERFSADDCEGEDLEQFLEITGLTEPQYFVRFVEFEVGRLNACPTSRIEPLAAVVEDDRAVSPVNGTLLDRRDVPRSFVMGTGSCEGDGRRAALVLCAQLFVLQNDLNAVLTTTVQSDVDTTVPPQAAIDEVTPGDGVVTVVPEAITVDDPDTYSFIVQSRPCGSDGGEGEGEGEGEGDDDDGDGVASLCDASGDFDETEGGSAVDVDAENGQQIELRLIAVDDFGNRGPPSGLQLARAVADLSPLDLYDGPRNALSCNPQSCNDGTAAFALPVGLLLLLRRRRRRFLRGGDRDAGGALLVLTLFFASSASAQTAEAEAADARRPWSGLGRSTMSLWIGAYEPNLDAGSDFPIYGCFFEGKTLPRIGGEGDFHVVDVFGSLQLSAGFDITQANGFAQPLAAATTGECEEPTDTKVQLTMASVRPGVTYRFDPLLDWFKIPLVPYGRVGLVFQGYLFSKDGDVTVDDGEENPIGLRYGGEAAVGLMLALDFLDFIPISPKDATRRARANGAFDHAFLYVEGAAQDVRSFGAGGFDFSPRDDFLNTGLPVMWKAGIAVELL